MNENEVDLRLLKPGDKITILNFDYIVISCNYDKTEEYPYRLMLKINNNKSNRFGCETYYNYRFPILNTVMDTCREETLTERMRKALENVDIKETNFNPIPQDNDIEGTKQILSTSSTIAGIRGREENKMTVDLSTLKEGDLIKYRKDAIDAVLGIRKLNDASNIYELWLQNEELQVYYNHGNYYKDEESGADIVEIIPKAVTIENKKMFKALDNLDILNSDLFDKIGEWDTKEKDPTNLSKGEYDPATAKTDIGKDRLDLLPYAGLASAAKGFEYGMSQYGHNNYLKAKSFRPFIAAAIRHGMKKLNGEDLDEDSGLDHMCHMAACILMADDLRAKGKPMDDPDTMKPYGVRNKPKGDIK